MCAFLNKMVSKKVPKRHPITGYKLIDIAGNGIYFDGFSVVNSKTWTQASKAPTKRNTHGWYAYRRRSDAEKKQLSFDRIVKVLLSGAVVRGSSNSGIRGLRAEYAKLAPK